MKLFILGYPSDLGGANTECWHTIKLWRRAGCDVTAIPTWQELPGWRQRLEAIGVSTHAGLTPENWRPGVYPRDLPGAVVVAFCNTKFLAEAHRFRALGCRIVWVGCMNFIFPGERLHYQRHGVFDRYVFQSRYQQDELAPQLRRFGYQDDRGRMLRGAFCCDEFPFRPLGHTPGTPLVVGRLSRAAPDKYSRDTWRTYGRILHPARARIMGWNAEVEAVVGRPPDWAEVLPPCAMSAADFLATLHAAAMAGGGAIENWPRIGLEAMATGVPLVAERQGGWPEMICHGITGYLADTPDEMAYHVSRLAYDEPHRQAIIHQARHVLERELAEPETIWRGWKSLFEELNA